MQKLTFHFESSLVGYSIGDSSQIGSSKDKVECVVVVLVEFQDDVGMSDSPGG